MISPEFSEYIKNVVIPAAIKDAETNPDNPWYKAYKDFDWEKFYSENKNSSVK